MSLGVLAQPVVRWHATPDVAWLRSRHGHLDGPALLNALLGPRGPLRDRTALVSAFGGESVVLLHMAAQVDRALPVIFLDTGRHFPETLAYRDQVVDQLGLQDVRTAYPDRQDLRRHDRRGRLSADDPDLCCDIRKTQPLAEELEGFAAWITGRKRFQGGLRAELDVIEAEAGAGRVKLNPLATWDAERIERYRVAHDLPAHPLLAQGYRSIGCASCTRPTRPGESARAGRWFGIDKTECGIHLPEPYGDNI
jgi:phosphoadenosine phosphosulfate reductase